MLVLFPNIKGAVEVAVRKLENDLGLPGCMNLMLKQIAYLLDFDLRSTYFQYNGLTYEQQHEAAMGSPVSAVRAYM